MAVKRIKAFDDWYVDREEDPRTGKLEFRGLDKCAEALFNKWQDYRREMDARVAEYYKLVMLADAEVISKKPDLPNVSSGETSGMILRMARNLVQNTPNVEVISGFDDDSPEGIFARYILKAKVIGDDQYSNDMQQNLFASAKNSLTLGFDCVIPSLQQRSSGEWYIQYDNIYYRDVFPEPGVKDIRRASDVFVRRYLSSGDVAGLIRGNIAGWDIAALKRLSDTKPPPRQRESVDRQSEKHRTIPDGYEVITWYSNSGDEFLTFDANTKLLLRIEKNKHPVKEHPVFFMIMEKDLNQPLGRSQIERIIGRQEFQDLMLNGAMKSYYRNINPSILSFGTTNATVNLSPGKITQIGNPNARIEAFEVNSQTLMQFGTISQQNAANMVQQVGAADQQMASMNTGGMMSQTPQGVEAQQAMVDITTNNFQKAIESFFSRYCSYALTIYFQELKGQKNVRPTADARKQLLHANFPTDRVNDDGVISIDFSDLATEYFVRTVPGSLVEMEDEKQLRILNELFIPLSQAMPALAAAGDNAAIQKASAAMQFIVQKQLELSGSMHSGALKTLMEEGPSDAFNYSQQAIQQLELSISDSAAENERTIAQLTAIAQQQQEQLSMLQEAVLRQTGGSNQQSAGIPAEAPV